MKLRCEGAACARIKHKTERKVPNKILITDTKRELNNTVLVNFYKQSAVLFTIINLIFLPIEGLDKE